MKLKSYLHAHTILLYQNKDLKLIIKNGTYKLKICTIKMIKKKCIYNFLKSASFTWKKKINYF